MNTTTSTYHDFNEALNALKGFVKFNKLGDLRKYKGCFSTLESYCKAGFNFFCAVEFIDGVAVPVMCFCREYKAEIDSITHTVVTFEMTCGQVEITTTSRKALKYNIK